MVVRGITVKDVARAAKVSVATVSRVLNDYPFVSEAVRQRVLEAARTLDYRPNSLARGLVTRASGTIGLIIPNIASPFFPPVVRGVEAVAFRQGYHLILSDTDQDVQREVNILGLMQQRQVDGIVFMSEQIRPEHRRAFQRAGIPIVLAATHDDDFALPAVIIDNHRAAEEATRYLIGLGHRRIALISGPLQDLIAGKPRFDGYVAALATAGIPFLPAYVQSGDFHVESGQRAMERLLRLPQPPTAVFAASDEMAMGALAALQDAGLRCPDDISLVGFDDIWVAAALRPALTTMSQPMFEIGVRAMQMLAGLIRGRPPEPPVQRLPHRLVVRQSTAAVGQRR